MRKCKVLLRRQPQLHWIFQRQAFVSLFWDLGSVFELSSICPHFRKMTSRCFVFKLFIIWMTLTFRSVLECWPRRRGRWLSLGFQSSLQSGGGEWKRLHSLYRDWILYFCPRVFVLEVFRINRPAQFLAEDLTLKVMEAAERWRFKTLLFKPGKMFLIPPLAACLGKLFVSQPWIIKRKPSVNILVDTYFSYLLPRTQIDQISQ